MKSAWTLLVVAAACGSGSKPPPPPDDQGVELVWPGSPPRELLRYQVAKGAKTQLEIVLDVDLDAGGLGSPLPRLTVGSDLVVEALQPDGAARIRVTLREVTATARDLATVSAAAMTEHMSLLEGVTLVGTLLPDGGIRDLQVEAAVTLPPGLQQQVAQVQAAVQRIAMPLPRVPVGTGAIWRQIKPFDQGGMQLVAATTLTLGAIEGTRVSYSMVTSLRGRDQTVAMQGMSIQVSGIGGNGSGTGVLDLARMTATGASTLALHSTMTAAGASDLMQMTVTTRVATKP